MNKTELITDMAEASGLTKKDCDTALNAFVDTLQTALNIFLYKISHNPTGLTSCTRTLQTDIYKAAIIDDPGRIC